MSINESMNQLFFEMFAVSQEDVGGWRGGKKETMRMSYILLRSRKSI